MKIENKKILHTDILIIGGGTAGCYAALTIREKSDYSIIIAEKANIKRSGCLAAGVNAINAYIVKDRKPEDYVDYAKKDADGIVREDLLMTMSEGLNRVTDKMEKLGLVILKDENGEYVFNNKEITVTSSDANLMKINGYRAAVDLFTYDKDTTANLIVTFTREGVTATKEIPITVSVKDINEQLDAEIAMMDYAKAHYFDGIKGDNADADSITTNLHAFQEMYLDNEGKAVWVYNADDKTGAGIITDDYFDDPWIMEGQGYNHFKSSNNAVIQHENLVVNRPESNTQLTISSLLSSEKYGQFAKDHLDNAKLQKLYKQEASVTVTVKGTKAEGEAFGKAGNDVFRKIETLPIFVFAAINGFALGGGCEISMSCDIRLCSENAVFGQPEAGLGITPGFGGTQRLARIVGPGKAKQLIYTARNIKAAEAYRIGLVNEVYPLEELMPQAKKMAKGIAKNAPIAVRACKKAINEGLEVGMDEAIVIEEKLFGSCFETEDQKYGMAFFLDKNKEKVKEPFKNC